MNIKKFINIYKFIYLDICTGLHHLVHIRCRQNTVSTIESQVQNMPDIAPFKKLSATCE